MITLPWKPSKNVKIKEKGQGRYTLTFLSCLKNREEFEDIIKDDLKLCLGEHDYLKNPDWKNKSIILITQDVDSFKRKLVFHSIIIKDD